MTPRSEIDALCATLDVVCKRGKGKPVCRTHASMHEAAVMLRTLADERDALAKDAAQLRHALRLHCITKHIVNLPDAVPFYRCNECGGEWTDRDEESHSYSVPEEELCHAALPLTDEGKE